MDLRSQCIRPGGDESLEGDLCGSRAWKTRSWGSGVPLGPANQYLSHRRLSLRESCVLSRSERRHLFPCRSLAALTARRYAYASAQANSRECDDTTLGPFLQNVSAKVVVAWAERGISDSAIVFLPYKNVQFAGDARKDRKNRVAAGFFRLGKGLVRRRPHSTGDARGGGAPNMKKERILPGGMRSAHRDCGQGKSLRRLPRNVLRTGR